MTPGQRKQLAAYIDVIRDAMRLNEWDFWVSSDLIPDDERAMLSIEVDIRRHFGKIRVGTFFYHDPDDTLEYTREEQRQTVIHEILHTCHANLTWWFDHGPWLQFDMTRIDRQLVEQMVMATFEITMDTAARLIAPSMPMPPEWEDWPNEPSKPAGD